MISRDFGDGGWAAGPHGNPPPLHVYDTESEMANWHPYVRPVLRPTVPGPVMVTAATLGGAGSQLGDDPTDPARQDQPRIPTTGMIGRFHAQVRASI